MAVKRRARAGLLPLLLIATALAAGACDPDEQGRPLRYQKGTYLGKADPPLDSATEEELRRRALNQGGI